MRQGHGHWPCIDFLLTLCFWLLLVSFRYDPLESIVTVESLTGNRVSNSLGSGGWSQSAADLQHLSVALRVPSALHLQGACS